MKTKTRRKSTRKTKSRRPKSMLACWMMSCVKGTRSFAKSFASVVF
jgi:hypothetical protein